MNNSGRKKDQEICVMLSSMNQKGMDLLFDAYYKPLVVWADTFLRDMNLAEDVVQDLFVSIWKDKVYLRFKPETLSSFLHVSVRNRCFKRIEKRDVFRNASVLDHVELVFEEYNERHDQLVSRVLEEMALLPERSREIMNCVFLEGLKYREVAERYGISVSTVKTLLGNSVKKLRERLNKELFSGFLLFYCRWR
ncbi:sigma-70 family RNA polymerase sigma factor [Butyricimonas sp. NSJ-56]|uniref:Sigma-70 family RNA polymerase sigma factor n=2 Tax=Butyricimonas hominis TaxID=2763032 RepID=A0ABR7CX37_9BACT|nr:sigma-70 family RNA polymerase sigma factor [Butyricimonas hominis]